MSWKWADWIMQDIDLLEQLEALRQEAERKRVRREACADLRQHREGM